MLKLSDSKSFSAVYTCQKKHNFGKCNQWRGSFWTTPSATTPEIRLLAGSSSSAAWTTKTTQQRSKVILPNVTWLVSAMSEVRSSKLWQTSILYHLPLPVCQSGLRAKTLLWNSWSRRSTRCWNPLTVMICLTAQDTKENEKNSHVMATDWHGRFLSNENISSKPQGKA